MVIIGFMQRRRANQLLVDQLSMMRTGYTESDLKAAQGREEEARVLVNALVRRGTDPNSPAGTPACLPTSAKRGARPTLGSSDRQLGRFGPRREGRHGRDRRFVLHHCAGVLYFLPWIVAANRRLPNVGSVAVINILLGWSVIGWVVALAMACGSAGLAPTLPSRAREEMFGAPCVNCGFPRDSHSAGRCPQQEVPA